MSSGGKQTGACSTGWIGDIPYLVTTTSGRGVADALQTGVLLPAFCKVPFMHLPVPLRALLLSMRTP